jgi:TPR repeat protein
MKIPSLCSVLLATLFAAWSAIADEATDCSGIDATKAAAACRHLAEQGVVAAEYNLAILYYNGNGVSQDYGEAAKWFRKAAEQGDAEAQYSLGILYALGGRGVPQDDAEAVRWYRRAAEQGVAGAANNLGNHYRTGAGVATDEPQAVRWFRMAADKGDPAAQVNLGAMYASGRGVQQDYVEALKWYREAAERGYAAALYNLGVAYKRGHGVPGDDVAAYMWMKLAAERGDTDAPARIGDLTRSLSPEQIGRAQGMAADWLSSHPHLGPPTDSDVIFAPVKTPIFTSRDRGGIGYIGAVCPGTTYVIICNGLHCEYGMTRMSLSGGAPRGSAFETDVRRGSTYCISCAGPPDPSNCQKAAVPLR